MRVFSLSMSIGAFVRLLSMLIFKEDFIFVIFTNVCVCEHTCAQMWLCECRCFQRSEIESLGDGVTDLTRGLRTDFRTSEREASALIH